jgi:hypothetical protein
MARYLKPRRSGANEGEVMVVCPVRRFNPELIRVYEKRILKKLVWDTIGEIQCPKDNPDIPACVRLLAGVLLDDLEAGRIDTINGIVVYRFNCKTLEELLRRYLLRRTIPA